VLTVTQQKLRTPYAQHYNLMVHHFNFQARRCWNSATSALPETKLPRIRQMNQAFITQAQIDKLLPTCAPGMEIMVSPTSEEAGRIGKIGVRAMLGIAAMASGRGG